MRRCMGRQKVTIKAELRKIWETLERLVTSQSNIMRIVSDLTALYKREFQDEWDLTEMQECDSPRSPPPGEDPMRVSGSD